MHDELSIFPGAKAAASILLLSLRLTAVFLMTPVLYAAPLPAIVRILLVMGLSTALAAGLAGDVVAHGDLLGLLQAGLQELALGATLGLGVLLAFGAFAVAGRLLDIQIGFGIAQVFDPLSKTQLPIVTSLFNQIAVLTFFLIDGHHALLRALAYSLQVFPLGRPWHFTDSVVPILKQTAGLFGISFALAAPVVLCLAMVELALGVVARNLPQVNMLVLGIPIKIVVGLLALSLWFAGMGGFMGRVYGGIYATWSAIFAGQPQALPTTRMPEGAR